MILDLFFFNLCLYLPCQDTYTQHKVKLVIVTKGLHQCDNLGGKQWEGE